MTNNERLESMVIFKTMFFSILLGAIGRILLITQEGVDELKKKSSGEGCPENSILVQIRVGIRIQEFLTIFATLGIKTLQQSAKLIEFGQDSQMLFQKDSCRVFFHGPRCTVLA